MLLLSTFLFRIDASKSTFQAHEEGIVMSVLFIGIIALIAALLLPPLLKTKLQTTSGNIHLNDFTAGFQAFIDSPIVGHGIGNYTGLAEYTSAYKSVFSPTSTLMAVSAQGGLILLIAYIFPLFLLLRKDIQKKGNYMVVITVLLIFCLCIVEDAALLFLFQAFGYSKLTTLKRKLIPDRVITTKNHLRSQQIDS
jgi:O-antigen ligase